LPIEIYVAFFSVQMQTDWCEPVSGSYQILKRKEEVGGITGIHEVAHLGHLCFSVYLSGVNLPPC
jgi:hypothetical protein